jgi:hypothetical protein
VATAPQGRRPQTEARADLLRRAGRAHEATAAYRTAIDLCRGEPERRFLAERLAEVTAQQARGERAAARRAEVEAEGASRGRIAAR